MVIMVAPRMVIICSVLFYSLTDHACLLNDAWDLIYPADHKITKYIYFSVFVPSLFYYLLSIFLSFRPLVCTFDEHKDKFFLPLQATCFTSIGHAVFGKCKKINASITLNNSEGSSINENQIKMDTQRAANSSRDAQWCPIFVWPLSRDSALDFHRLPSAID